MNGVRLYQTIGTGCEGIGTAVKKSCATTSNLKKTSALIALIVELAGAPKIAVDGFKCTVRWLDVANLYGGLKGVYDGLEKPSVDLVKKILLLVPDVWSHLNLFNEVQLIDFTAFRQKCSDAAEKIGDRYPVFVGVARIAVDPLMKKMVAAGLLIGLCQQVHLVWQWYIESERLKKDGLGHINLINSTENNFFGTYIKNSESTGQLSDEYLQKSKNDKIAEIQNNILRICKLRNLAVFELGCRALDLSSTMAVLMLPPGVDMIVNLKRLSTLFGWVRVLVK